MDDVTIDSLMNRIKSLEHRMEFLLQERQQKINLINLANKRKERYDEYRDQFAADCCNPNA